MAASSAIFSERYRGQTANARNEVALPVKVAMIAGEDQAGDSGPASCSAKMRNTIVPMTSNAPTRSACDQGILPRSVYFGQITTIAVTATALHGTSKREHHLQPRASRDDAAYRRTSSTAVSRGSVGCVCREGRFVGCGEKVFSKVFSMVEGRDRRLCLLFCFVTTCPLLGNGSTKPFFFCTNHVSCSSLCEIDHVKSLQLE
jgi:hypothetical protein